MSHFSKTPKNHTRREEILEAAAKLFQKKGFKGTSCDDIAEKMGFTKASIYYYFKNKEAILKEVNDRASMLFLTNAKKIVQSHLKPDQKLRNIFYSHIKLILENPTLVSVLFRERRELPSKSGKNIFKINKNYNDLLKNIYKEGVEQDLFIDIPPIIAISAIFGSTNRLQEWFDPQGRYSCDDIANYYFEIVTSGYLIKNKHNDLPEREDK